MKKSLTLELFLLRLIDGCLPCSSQGEVIPQLGGEKRGGRGRGFPADRVPGALQLSQQARRVGAAGGPGET